MSSLNYISAEEVAKELNLKQRTIQKWCKSKKLKAYKLGKEWRIPLDMWEQYKEQLIAGLETV